MMPRTLVSGGTVLVLDGARPAQEAMVVDGGRVLGVGTKDAMTALAGRGAERLDLRGATAMPGLVNGHPHMLHFGALTAPIVDLFDARDHDDIVERIRVRAESTPAGEWILCSPVGEPHYFLRRSHLDLPEKRLPHRDVLDRATRVHPVLIQAWAPKTPNACAFNSPGLARVGIGRITPAQVCDVTIEKDDHGYPTGILRGPVNNYYSDDPFWLQIVGRLPQPNDMLWEIGAWEGMKMMNRLGVAAGYEAHVMDLAHIQAHPEVLLTLSLFGLLHRRATCPAACRGWRRDSLAPPAAAHMAPRPRSLPRSLLLRPVELGGRAENAERPRSSVT